MCVASQYDMAFKTISDTIRYLFLPITAKHLTPGPDRKTANAPRTTTLTLLFLTYPQISTSKFDIAQTVCSRRALLLHTRIPFSVFAENAPVFQPFTAYSDKRARRVLLR
jgi:hypothetical protein